MDQSKPILVTGGTGYIGSHTCVSLIESGYQVEVIDNLSNSSQESLNRVAEITGVKIPFFNIDIMNFQALDDLFSNKKYGAVIHFAGLKAVGESVNLPLKYYSNNITGTINLLNSMEKSGVRNLIFSSSATVYGLNGTPPLKEDSQLGSNNPYGRTKYFIEEILRDYCVANDSWKVINLRYFNPVGAHISGKIGEDPIGIPNNLMPYIMQVAVGKREKLSVFGNDYPTPDGTCLRDYIHVVDLADGHVAALKKVSQVDGCMSINLGTGSGSSVLDVVNAASKAVGKDIPYEIVGRREGDAPITYADPSLANEFLEWTGKKTLLEMCEDSWRWQSANPNGYRDS